MSDHTSNDDLAAELMATFPTLYSEPTADRQARIEAELQRQENRRRARREEERRQKWAGWGIPSKDIKAIADQTLDITAAVAEMTAFEDRRAILFVLSGPLGCGKTTAAAQWLTHARERGTYITTKPRLFLPIATCARLNRYDDAALHRVERALALVLDDLGAEYLDQKGAFVSLLDSLIDARYRHLLPTVITTNLRATDFKARYGPRTVDRIRERGDFIEINGPSLRASKPARKR